MKSRSSKVAAWCLSLLATGCPVSDPPDENGLPQEPQQSGEQAETDAVVAETPNGNPVVVVGHRYTGSHPIGNVSIFPDDIEYFPDGSVVTRRFASVAGWSYSLDGISWTAPGKLSALPFLTFGDPVAVLWSDPALAVGMANKSLVVYANLAVSTERFDALAGGGDEVPAFLTQTVSPLGDPIDSLCVSVSIDGGQTFHATACETPEDVGVRGTDQTTVAIGSDDRIYVAADDFEPDRIRLYELVLHELPITSDASFSFVELPVTGMGAYSKGPELRRDQEGGVWLAATTSQFRRPGFRVCGVTPGAGCTFVGDGGDNLDTFPVVEAPGANVDQLRTATSADFGVHRVPGAGWRFFFAYAGNGQDRVFVNVSECALLEEFFLFGCEEVPEWGTEARSGQHIQPNIEVVDKSTAQDGSGLDVRYAFYDVDRAGLPSGRARLVQATLNGVHGGSRSLAYSTDGLSLSPAPRVCTAQYGSLKYWGDYFAHIAVPPLPGFFGLVPAWRHTAIYSTDEGRGCAPEHPLQGRHLHVASWVWLD